MSGFRPARLGGGGGRRRGGPCDDEDIGDHAYTKEDIAGLKYEPTTSFGLAKDEEFMVCPYDPVHVVPSSTTFYKHKLKCERKLKEQQGIPDAFNEMQYRNRYKSSLANQKPLPEPPVHVADLSLTGGYGPSTATAYPPTSTACGYYWSGAGAGFAEPSPFTQYVSSGPTAVMGVHPHAHPMSPSPYAYVPDPAGGPGPSGTTECGIPLQVLGMAASNLRYFEPSGLTPAMRREYRARRRAAAGYEDESPPSPSVTPNETSIPAPPLQRPRTAATVKKSIIEFTPSAYFKVNANTTNEGAAGVDVSKIQKQFAGIGLNDKDGNGLGDEGDLKYEEEEEEEEEDEEEEEEVTAAEKEVMEEVDEEVVEEEEEVIDEDDDLDVVLYYDDSD